MAECSYSRCIQQKRNIRRELQRWTKNMVHIVGLERIAEELMGRRKWKLYQESMSRNYLQPLNNNVKRTNQQETSSDEYQKEYSGGSDSEQTENKLYHHHHYHHFQNHQEVSARAGDTNASSRLTGAASDEDEKLVLSTKESEIKENGTDVGNAADRTCSLESRVRDWTPLDDKCYFCVDGKLDSEQSSHGVLSPRQSESDSSDSHSDNDTPTSLTPSLKLPAANNHHRPLHHPALPPGMTTIESMAAFALALTGNSLSGTPTPPIPFYPNVLSQNMYLANLARNFQNERLQAVTAAGVNDSEKGSGEQPLDLSKGSSSAEKIASNNNISNVRLPSLVDTKHIFKAKPRMSTVAGRRTYTEEELQAALRDIQSGKLGTRRAAVIYGIPRSTLRNKVYKLALERERENHLNNTVPLKIEDEEAMEDDNQLSGAEEEKELESVLNSPLLTISDLVRVSKMPGIPDALKTILQRSKDGQDIAWPGLEQGEIAPYLHNLILASQKPTDGNIPHQMKRMLSEEQVLKLKMNGDCDKNKTDGILERSKSESEIDAEEASANVILKIPSFRPTTSKNGSDLFRNIEGATLSPSIKSESNSPPIIPNKITIKDVKDVIAQSISQKFQQQAIVEPPIIRRPIIEMDYKRNDFTPPLGSGISVIKTNPQDISRGFQSSSSKPQTGSSGSSGGKGTRPKRGKYRNYDRDSLVEAVRAVQRGEMSVHRAGSYYGVPHSTLEYKVKERHLMRPRKRDPKPNPVDEKIASLKQNDLRNAQEKMKTTVVMKPPQKFSPTSPNGMKIPFLESGISTLPGYNAPPPFPFWPHPGFHHIPLDYARNPSTPFPPNPEFFASQMMQKLQEETSRTLASGVPTGGGVAAGSISQNPTTPATPTLAKSARQMAESLLDGTGSNGSFLDGIIRSSLESGVPTGDKSPKEEKNLALENLSNKALIDQLCRNSRLTPLSKISAGENTSSGDESYRKGSSPLNFSSSGSNVKEEPMDDSPSYDRENSDLHTIELSNDSHESVERKHHQPENKMLPGRIYLKQDLVDPDNLKPEMLVRFIPEMDRNGVSSVENPDSASDNDAPQD